MFAVVYQFQLKPNREEEFVKNWSELTELIYAFEGSLGSRLHKVDDLHFMAYAQWPSKIIWENSGSKLPVEAQRISHNMHACCEKIETLYQLDVHTDLLQRQQSNH